MRESLIAAYLEYVNDYLTIERYAEHHGLTVSQAERLIALGKEVHEAPHPDS